MSLKTPIKFPVKFYSWQDTDAPILEDVDGCIKTILKACLVNGYGDKEGAGWTMPFEDDYRMILRRPLRTGSPPDIKIENGVTNGVSSHRIVAQDNPTGLDDSNELSATFLHSRNNSCGQQWYMLVTDFACMLFYEMAYYNSSIAGTMQLLYLGSAKKIFDADTEYHFATLSSGNINNGLCTTSSGLFASSSLGFFEMRSGQQLAETDYIEIDIAEKINDGYLAQPVIFGEKVVAPFMVAMTKQLDNTNWGEVTIDGRPFFRCAQGTYRAETAIYTPMDYWEL